jgi:lipopolysaccharide transport system permease protein
VGWLLSALGVVVRDIGQLAGLVAHALLFLTPIFYGIDAVPALLQNVLLANPLTFVVEQLRLVLYFGHAPDFRGLAVYFVLASLFAALCLAVFRRMRPRFADLL